MNPTFASGFMTDLRPDDLERFAQRFELHLTSTETGRVTVVGDEGQVTYDGDVAEEDWDTSGFYRHLDS